MAGNRAGSHKSERKTSWGTGLTIKDGHTSLHCGLEVPPSRGGVYSLPLNLGGLVTSGEVMKLGYELLKLPACYPLGTCALIVLRSLAALKLPCWRDHMGRRHVIEEPLESSDACLAPAQVPDRRGSIPSVPSPSKILNCPGVSKWEDVRSSPSPAHIADL